MEKKAKPYISDFNIYIYIYMLTCVLLIYSFFFANLFFFKEEKDLPFSNTCRTLSFLKTNLISSNLFIFLNYLNT